MSAKGTGDLAALSQSNTHPDEWMLKYDALVTRNMELEARERTLMADLHKELKSVKAELESVKAELKLVNEKLDKLEAGFDRREVASCLEAVFVASVRGNLKARSCKDLKKGAQKDQRERFAVFDDLFQLLDKEASTFAQLSDGNPLLVLQLIEDFVKSDPDFPKHIVNEFLSFCEEPKHQEELVEVVKAKRDRRRQRTAAIEKAQQERHEKGLAQQERHEKELAQQHKKELAQPT